MANHTVPEPPQESPCLSLSSPQMKPNRLNTVPDAVYELPQFLIYINNEAQHNEGTTAQKHTSTKARSTKARGKTQEGKQKKQKRKKTGKLKKKLKKNVRLHRLVKTVGLVGSRDMAVLWCVVCELPTASSPKGARVYCGYRSGPTGVMPPSRQDDGNIRAPALACVLAVCVLHCARGRVCSRWFCGEVLFGFRTPPRTMSLAFSFDLARPRDSTFSIHGIHLQLAARDLGHW